MIKLILDSHDYLAKAEAAESRDDLHGLLGALARLQDHVTAMLDAADQGNVILFPGVEIEAEAS
ncbi:hypothetical protein SAMN04488020_103204 [Palleronia marisminoris]|uniref:Uncharacterized protein n=1 Tax=Palleronia marisminoris TaxID=315423 RepID=A0A1Y5SAE0_9RHOB|nr:hypothetical protein [Palleronia marisminoris]SFG69154.1 hypothetical protein SAMN04488020_103204 [Palleronia marisminoris]SLN35444.1 hypothetical protein PAM7066_01484 [Palleronia marisminoris]